MTGNLSWTIAEDLMLKELCAEGLAYKEIARQLTEVYGTKRSRSSVIGRTNRLGMPKRPRPPVKIVNQPAGATKRTYTKPVPIKCNTGEGIPILELTSESCLFITNDIHKLYCGKKRHSRSYCIEHHNVCYQVPKIV